MSAKQQLSRGVLRREPCFKCDLPVFLAEKLTIDGRMYHRTCLKCARCGHQLTPGSFYETEVDAEFCCEVCPDEEKSASKEVPLEEEVTPSDIARQNSLLKKSLSDEAKRESLERMKGKDQQKGMLSFIETQFEDLEVGVSEKSVKTETLNAQGAQSDIGISDDDELKMKEDIFVGNKELLDPPVGGGIDSDTSVDDKLSKLVLDDKEPTPREEISSPEIPCVTKDDEIVANDEPIVPDQEDQVDQEEANVPACNTSVVIQVPIVDVKPDVSSSAALQPDIDESSDVVPEQPKVETYPNKLNPFDSDDDDEPEGEEEGEVAASGGREQKLNPFDSDDDEIEAEKMKRDQKSSNNPFEDDASDDEAKSLQSRAKPSPRRTPVPTPRKTVMKSPNQQYLLVSPGAIPKDLYGSTASLNSRNESHGSMNSLSSTSTAGGMTMARHKKGKAPLPPSAEKSPIGSQLSTPKSSPRTRKKRPAPAPPVPTKSPDTRRRLIPLDSELLTEMEVKGEEQSILDASEISYRRKIMPLEASDTEERESESHERQWEKLKDNKESKNRNRRSHIYQDVEGMEGLYGDKSSHGKWKKRKGPAPALPVPPKRVLRMLPLQDILHELEVIEVQQQGLEKQGITLEKIIRERCEGVAAEGEAPPEEEVLSRDSLARLPTQNTKEVEDLIMQLFDLVNEKNELFRRQAELMYLRRQHRLEQEQIDLEYEIRVMMAQPERNKTDSDKAKEEAMISRLVEVVQLRNDVVDNLEMDRLREAEEDLSIKQEIEKHTAKRDESFKEEDVTTKLSKKEKKKQKEAKKLKNKKIDIDKDDDETESSGNVVRKKKKKFIII